MRAKSHKRRRSGICHHLDNDDLGKTEVTRRKGCCVAIIYFSGLLLVWVGCHLLFILPSTCDVLFARSNGQRGGVLISLDGETSMEPDCCAFSLFFLFKILVVLMVFSFFCLLVRHA